MEILLNCGLRRYSSKLRVPAFFYVGALIYRAKRGPNKPFKQKFARVLSRTPRERFLLNFAATFLLIPRVGKKFECDNINLEVQKIFGCQDSHTFILSFAYFLQPTFISCPVLMSKPFGTKSCLEIP